MGPYVIAIDGPAGSGKSTVSKKIAMMLGLMYIDTGAMYRALTFKAMRSGTDLADPSALTELAENTTIDLKCAKDIRVIMDGEDVSREIRTPEVTNNVKFVAGVPGVREFMVGVQRSIGSGKPSILEGRDIGTVVFKNAAFKFFLTADVEERAKRRHKELVEKGSPIDVERVKADVIARDNSDILRSVGPLKKADDAVEIDTTGLTIDEVVEKIVSYIRARGVPEDLPKRVYKEKR